MITPGGAYRLGETMRNIDKFAEIGKKLPLEKLMGFVDGIDECVSRNFLYKFDEPFILRALKTELSNKINLEQSKDINLSNYFGAYINGYLFFVPWSRELLDRIGKELPKYSNAMKFLEIPRFDKKNNYFRTKDNIYNQLIEKKLLVYDDRND